MLHFMTYVKSSYELVMAAEGRSCINLEPDTEAFLVHLLARHFENPYIPEDAVAISLMQALHMTGEQRKSKLQRVAEECILVDGLELNSRRWPSRKYYQDMAEMALECRAYSSRPPELFYEQIARQLPQLSRILHNLHP